MFSIEERCLLRKRRLVDAWSIMRVGLFCADEVGRFVKKTEFDIISALGKRRRFGHIFHDFLPIFSLISTNSREYDHFCGFSNEVINVTGKLRVKKLLVTVASCELGVASCELRVASCELRVASCDHGDQLETGQRSKSLRSLNFLTVLRSRLS